ncbi:NADPH-dependent ferric siderophore reductase [Leucobacter luti]|nr:NADPH-dependent ferric siderophore reductase [Leucobacter luti]
MAHHDLIIHPLVLRRVHVARMQDVTPRMRRVTLTGTQLGAFTQDGMSFPPFASPGFDDHVKLIFAADGDIASALPVQLAHGIEWGPSESRQGRDYTPRRFDPVTQELDLDFVLHGDGPAASWARDAHAGDELWFAGPKSSTVIPADVDWVLLAGDETAIPAIMRFLDERPANAPARVTITISEESAQHALQLRDEDRVEWVVAEPTDERALADAIARLAPLPGTPYVWAAAESRALLQVRRIARALGAPKSHTNITGYWHQRVGHDETTSQLPVPVLPEQPVMWFAVRAALQLGILDALAAEPLLPAALAVQLRIPSAAALAPLLTLLAQGGVLTSLDDGRYTLDRLGEELSEDEHGQERFTGFAADQVLTLAALPDAIAEGGSAWQRSRGVSLRTAVETEPEYFAELLEEAGSLPHVLTGLIQHPIWTGAATIAITGPGAVHIGRVLSGATEADLTIHESTGPLEALRAEADERDWRFSSQLPQNQDLAVTALAFGHRSDTEAIALLRALAVTAPRALLIERFTPDGLSEAADASHALVDFAAIGAPTRTPGATLRLAAAAGWVVGTRQKLGWGIESVELSRAAQRS